MSFPYKKNVVISHQEWIYLELVFLFLAMVLLLRQAKTKKCHLKKNSKDTSLIKFTFQGSLKYKEKWYFSYPIKKNSFTKISSIFFNGSFFHMKVPHTRLLIWIGFTEILMADSLHLNILLSKKKNIQITIYCCIVQHPDSLLNHLSMVISALWNLAELACTRSYQCNSAIALCFQLCFPYPLGSILTNTHMALILNYS